MSRCKTESRREGADGSDQNIKIINRSGSPSRSSANRGCNSDIINGIRHGHGDSSYSVPGGSVGGPRSRNVVSNPDKPDIARAWIGIRYGIIGDSRRQGGVCGLPGPEVVADTVAREDKCHDITRAQPTPHHESHFAASVDIGRGIDLEGNGGITGNRLEYISK